MKFSPALLIVIASLFASCAGSPTRLGDDDRAAIDAAYDRWYTAWRTKDAELAARDYSDDAIWVNAFGMKRVGRAEIEALLREVFAMDFVMAGDSRTAEKRIDLIAPNVATVSSRVERVGQEMPDGEALGDRRTSHLRVFVKSDGRWRIVNHLISDARSTERPEH